VAMPLAPGACPVSAILSGVAPVDQIGPEQITAEQIGTALRMSWYRQPDTTTVLRTGRNTVSWRIEIGSQQFTAIVVPGSRRTQLEAGLTAADCLEQAGLSAGRPIRAEDGALTVLVAGAALALLTWVPGRPLDPADPIDQQWWGDTLGAVHCVLRAVSHPGLTRVPRLRPDPPYLDLQDWVRPAVVRAITAVNRLSVTDQLTYGLLHGDPAPDAFRLDPETGRIGLLDWTAAGSGPLVYDVAIAVAHAGSQEQAGDLLEAYRAAGPVPRAELDAGLETMLRFHYAVQADQLTRRLARGEGGGAPGPDEESDRAALRRVGDALAAMDARGRRRRPEDDPDW
jgi:Ser/Thr protein kinase RdoA (MazF antagonist)